MRCGKQDLRWEERQGRAVLKICPIGLSTVCMDYWEGGKRRNYTEEKKSREIIEKGVSFS